MKAEYAHMMYALCSMHVHIQFSGKSCRRIGTASNSTCDLGDGGGCRVAGGGGGTCGAVGAYGRVKEGR
jgi:hypothetical protein